MESREYFDKISVIIPIYNVEKYLKRCVDSVRAQTYQNMEIILVDDGSTDSCGAMCDEYEKQDCRIRVVHKKNGGLSSARNAGLDIAEGDLISFVDSDDFIEKDMIEKLYKALIESTADMALCNFQYADEKGNRRNDYPADMIKGGLIDREKYWSGVVNSYDMAYVVAWNKLYQRKIWKDLRYPMGKRNEDEFVICKIVVKCEKIIGVPYVGYNYVQRKDSIMDQTRKRANFDGFEAWQEVIRYFQGIKREDYVRKLLIKYSAELCLMHFRCRTKEERQECRRVKQEYQKMYEKYYSLDTAPLKEQIKAIGCRRMPAITNLAALIYQALWKRWMEHKKFVR